MSVDLKVYLSNSIDKNNIDNEFRFIEYYQVRITGDNCYKTYKDIIDNYEYKIDEDTNYESLAFDSYVLSVEKFKSDIICNSELKENIIKDISNLNYKYIIFQPF